MSCVGFSAYAITHRASGRMYIGMTTQCLTTRFRGHQSAAERGGPTKLSRAIRRYGASAFTVEKLASAWSWESLRKLEQILIDQFDTIYNGFNANPSKGRVCSPGSYADGKRFGSRKTLVDRPCVCHRPLVASNPRSRPLRETSLCFQSLTVR